MQKCAVKVISSYYTRAKSAQAPTISGPNIDRIQTKQAGYSETVCCNCAATISCQEPRHCSDSAIYSFLHGTAKFCARCSRPSKGNGSRLRQESGAWQQHIPTVPSKSRSSGQRTQISSLHNRTFAGTHLRIRRIVQLGDVTLLSTAYHRISAYPRPPYEPNSDKVNHF